MLCGQKEPSTRPKAGRGFALTSSSDEERADRRVGLAGSDPSTLNGYDARLPVKGNLPEELHTPPFQDDLEDLVPLEADHCFVEPLPLDLLLGDPD